MIEMSKRQIRYWLGAALIGFLTACGGGGGGDRAAGVEPGPGSPNGPVNPPSPVVPGPVGYADAEEIFAFITDAAFEGGNAVVTFQLTDGNNTAITDLELTLNPGTIEVENDRLEVRTRRGYYAVP